MRTRVSLVQPNVLGDDARLSGLPASTKYVRQSYITAAGESQGAPETNRAVPAGSLLTIASLAASAGATGWNAYVSDATGTETLQNATPIPIGTAWTMPATGLIPDGAALPSANTSGIDNPLANGALSLAPGNALGAVDTMNAVLHALGLHARIVELVHYDPLVNPGATAQRVAPGYDDDI